MSDMDPDSVGDLATSAVADLIQRIDPGAMLTSFVAVCGVVGSDGERAVWLLAPNDAKAWETLGLLEYARMTEQATVTRGKINE